jgi:hypothetical protein
MSPEIIITEEDDIVTDIAVNTVSIERARVIWFFRGLWAWRG